MLYLLYAARSNSSPTPRGFLPAAATHFPSAVAPNSGLLHLSFPCLGVRASSVPRAFAVLRPFLNRISSSERAHPATCARALWHHECTVEAIDLICAWPSFSSRRLNHARNGLCHSLVL